MPCNYSILNILLFGLLCFCCNTEGILVEGVDIYYGKCQKSQYLCSNGRCLDRSWLCDGRDDCGDNSDEEYCDNTYHSSCPSYTEFFQCGRRCIPKVWICDGIKDCSNGRDESECSSGVFPFPGSASKQRSLLTWLRSQRKSGLTTRKWGSRVPRVAVSLFFSNYSQFSYSGDVWEEVRYEEEIALLSRMLRRNEDPLSSAELALHIHALLVSCLNPRDFHGHDLVSNLRDLVKQQVNHTNPFALLALCNANDAMTEEDGNRLLAVLDNDDNDNQLWRNMDIQALAVMAISCMKEHVSVDYTAIIDDVLSKMKSLQSDDGSILNLKTTALVMQAILASGGYHNSVHMRNAAKYIVRSQKLDGSFGDLLNAYYIIPLFQSKSLADINADHCSTDSKKSEFFAIEDMRNKDGRKIYIKYSLWFDDKVDVSQTLKLRVVSNCTFFDIMKLASAISDKYEFKYFDIDSLPYIYSVAGIQNDPEKYKFWQLYRQTISTAVLELTEKSPQQVFAAEDDNFVLWYKTRHWNPPEELRKSLHDHNKITLQ